MKSWIVHYKNKYPGCRVSASENSLDVFSAEGEHLIHLEKGGDGMWHDKSEEFGLSHKHDLAPIPRDSRVHKIVEGKIGLDELHEERKQKREKFVRDGKVQSIAELSKEGFQFDDKGRVVVEGQSSGGGLLGKIGLGGKKPDGKSGDAKA